MHFPDDLRYTSDHEWARREDDGTVTVGITAFAADQLGAVVFVELPAPGTTVAAGAAIGQVESTKSVSDIYAPIAGRVVARNDALADAPEGINDGPYGDGWLVRIAPSDPSALDALLDADAYRAAVA